MAAGKGGSRGSPGARAGVGAGPGSARVACLGVAPSATVCPHACTRGSVFPVSAPAAGGAELGDCVGIALATRCRLVVQFERSDSSDCFSAPR